MRKRDVVTLLQIGFVSGSLIGLILFLINLVFVKFNPEGIVQGSWLLTLTLFVMLLFANRMAFQQGHRYYSPRSMPLSSIAILSFSTSIALAAISGLDNYLISAIIEPNYLDHLMIAAEANWQAQSYSPEIIAGQAEHYMYSSPLNFAISGAKFMFFLNLFIALITSFFFRAKMTKLEPTKLNFQ